MLGFILGPMLEEYFRRAMVLSHGNLATFVHQPISASLLGFTAILVLGQAVLAIRKALSTGPSVPDHHNPREEGHDDEIARHPGRGHGTAVPADRTGAGLS
jgi:hypothetical protein